MRSRAKKWLAGQPSLYRMASVSYRSLGVLKSAVDVVEQAPKIMMGERPIVVRYEAIPKPRWTFDDGGQPRLAAIIGNDRDRYRALLHQMAPLRRSLEAINDVATGDADPSWNNTFFSGLDAAALYGILSNRRPQKYLEIGSGNSTKIARRAIRDQGLPTKILSVDPSPRAEVDAICDELIRRPLEEVNVSIFDELVAGDVLFLDGSHHAFMNSDVIVFWLEILPRLKSGVVVHIHDIFLPYDYPQDWADRYYTEQYLLAVALIAPTRTFDILLPNQFVFRDPDLWQTASHVLGHRVAEGGSSFWITMK